MGQFWRGTPKTMATRIERLPMKIHTCKGIGGGPPGVMVADVPIMSFGCFIHWCCRWWGRAVWGSLNVVDLWALRPPP